MSVIFEGILLLRKAVDAPGLDLVKVCESRMSGIRLRQALLDDHVAAIMRVRDRDAAFSEEVERLGAERSSRLGRALVARHDSRIGHRSSSFFEPGRLAARFGEEDEIFTPLDAGGSTTGARFRVEDRDEGEEYETIENAIPLGLDRLGADSWEDLPSFIHNQEDLLS